VNAALLFHAILPDSSHFFFALRLGQSYFGPGLSGGVMVAQGPLEAFVMVRIHAGQPTFTTLLSMSANAQFPPAVPPPPRLGLAIASLALGILAFILSLFVIGLIFGVVGFVLGLVHILGRRGPNTMAWFGVSFSILGVIASIGLGIVYYKGFLKFKDAIASMNTGGSANSFEEWEGVLAPDISVTTLEGKPLKLSELKGKRVVLDFWATWRGPCVKEIPHFVKLHNETSRDELMIVGISQEDESTLKSFVNKKGVNYPIASASDLPAPYKDVQSFPTTFFIDRKGVIQTVTVGYREFSDLKGQAITNDFEGEAKAAPLPVSGLTESDKLLSAMLVWSNNVPGGQAICVGDWDGDSASDILVADAGKKLHVFSLDGAKKTSVSLPDQFAAIECGHHQQKGVRLLGYTSWAPKVSVMDRSGKELWNYSATMGGIDGAHWGDLDGDGTDELVVGMNGFGGVHAVSAEGKRIWHAASFGNVWNQAVIPAGKERPALVFATEAGGSVQVFDAKGKVLRSLRPRGKYYTQMTAAMIDRSNTVQVVAIGDGNTTAFDANGKLAWSTPANANTSGSTAFAHGDIDGDGVSEWAFIDAAGDLVLATTTGVKLSSIAGQSGLSGFVLAPGKKTSRLITLGSESLQAFTFE
jgi:peroxiredoxin/outer membrane protein assembly factor BamB